MLKNVADGIPIVLPLARSAAVVYTKEKPPYPGGEIGGGRYEKIRRKQH
jgi:hypothetical protein